MDARSSKENTLLIYEQLLAGLSDHRFTCTLPLQLLIIEICSIVILHYSYLYVHKVDIHFFFLSVNLTYKSDYVSERYKS